MGRYYSLKPLNSAQHDRLNQMGQHCECASAQDIASGVWKEIFLKGNYDNLIVGNHYVDDGLLNAWRQARPDAPLNVIRWGSDIGHIAFASALEEQVNVTNTAGATGALIAEYILHEMAKVSWGVNTRGEPIAPLPVDVLRHRIKDNYPLNKDGSKKKICLVGTGAIAVTVMRQLLSIGLDVNAWSPHAAEKTPPKGAQYHEQIHDAAKGADVLINLAHFIKKTEAEKANAILAARGLPQTFTSSEGMIGEDVLSVLNQNCDVISPSSPYVFDLHALQKSVQSGRVARVAVDTTPQDCQKIEKDPELSGLRTSPKVRIEPSPKYFGALTADQKAISFEMLIETIARLTERQHQSIFPQGAIASPEARRAHARLARLGGQLLPFPAPRAAAGAIPLRAPSSSLGLNPTSAEQGEDPRHYTIVGAGPVGLMQAIMLTLSGVQGQKITVVDDASKQEYTIPRTLRHLTPTEALPLIDSAIIDKPFAQGGRSITPIIDMATYLRDKSPSSTPDDEGYADISNLKAWHDNAISQPKENIEKNRRARYLTDHKSLDQWDALYYWDEKNNGGVLFKGTYFKPTDTDPYQVVRLYADEKTFANDKAGFDKLCEKDERFNDDGSKRHYYREIPLDELPQCYQNSQITHAMRIRGTSLDLEKFTSNARAFLQRAGSRFIKGRVNDIEAEGGVLKALRLEQSDEPLDVDQVVFATGMGSTSLHSKLGLKEGSLAAMGGVMYRVSIGQNGRKMDLPPEGKPFKYVHPTFGVIVVARAGEHIHHGGGHYLTVMSLAKDNGANPGHKAQQAMEEAVRQFYPNIGDVGLELVYNCARPTTPDFMPVVGQSPSFSNVHMNVGHYAGGAISAPASAVAVAKEMGLKPEALGLRPSNVSRLNEQQYAALTNPSRFAKDDLVVASQGFLRSAL